MKLTAELLDTSRGLIASPGDLYACLNAHGLYNSMHFVLRLSPLVHKRLSELPNGVTTAGAVGFEGAQAFSTLLHETIHWWQHIGSTTGFISSLSYPNQAHANYGHKKRLLAQFGASKPIEKLVEILPGPAQPDTSLGLANIIVNNHYDIEFFRALINEPRIGNDTINHRFFESVGHSYSICYANNISMLATMFDHSFEALPDARKWEDDFASLRSSRKKGYYYGSQVTLSPIGTRQIFEGQARFSQLQYLYFFSGGSLTWEDVAGLGMLSGVYREAFDTFLRFSEAHWPSKIDDPVVGLFLLICDMAINPGEGFPVQLRSFSTFITDVDPGMRFLFLCRAIALKQGKLLRAITNYSKEEYEEVSDIFSIELLLISPMGVAETVNRWSEQSDGINQLMQRYGDFSYNDVNFPLSVLFSYFLAFAADKAKRPEFFCWPGASMTDPRLSPDVTDLFDRHSALFVDKEEDDSIFPRLHRDKDESVVDEMFQKFFAVSVVYDLTRQWIAVPGPFAYEYRWLSASGNRTAMRDFANRIFEQVYGIHPDNGRLL